MQTMFQESGIDRLDQIVIGPGVKAGLHIFRLALGGEHDDVGV